MGPVLVVGAGIIGRVAAWRLAERGHLVILVDPSLAPRTPGPSSARPGGPSPSANGDWATLGGSQASLGVLMAQVFHRSSGRAWRLRQRSHTLWGEWLAELECRGHRLPRRQGLLLLAATTEELARLERVTAERVRLGIPMRMLGPGELAKLRPELPGAPLGGLLSPEDGQIDPEPLLNALLQEACAAGEASAGGMTCVAEVGVAVERGRGAGRRWLLRLSGGGVLEAEWLVLAAGLGSTSLLPEALRPPPVRLEPVLGQALELELDPADRPGETGWPGSVVWRGVNLIQRPPAAAEDAAAPWRLWLGATLEPGQQASAEALAALRDLHGEAPAWLLRARLRHSWQGLRARPRGQPAPLLQDLGGGLLLAAGHYRNGVLLAPASAEWVCERIEAGFGAT